MFFSSPELTPSREDAFKRLCSSRDGVHLKPEKDTCRQDSLSKWIRLILVSTHLCFTVSLDSAFKHWIHTSQTNLEKNESTNHILICKSPFSMRKNVSHGPKYVCFAPHCHCLPFFGIVLVPTWNFIQLSEKPLNIYFNMCTSSSMPFSPEAGVLKKLSLAG